MRTSSDWDQIGYRCDRVFPWVIWGIVAIAVACIVRAINLGAL